MTRSKTAVFTATAAAMILNGCHDVNAPLARSLQPPVTVLKTVGPPDQSFSVPASRGFPPTKTYLMQFPWDTWVTLEAMGNVGFTRQPPIPGASANYTALYPAPPVGVTGIVDPYGDPCVMNLIPGDGVTNMPSFGNCGASPKVDTVLSQKNLIPYIMRGPLPSKHYYNCSNYTDVCDAVNAGSSTVQERPVPVALNKLKALPHTIDTLHLTAVQFTGSITPDSITVQGAKSAHPYHVTLWEWIGADMTRDPLASSATKVGCATTLLCQYTPPEAGRMVVKVFTGGYEQANSATIQCLVTPGDSILNDSVGDFSLREALRDAMDRSNPDSAPGAGANSLHAGYRREQGGVVWRLADGSYKAVRNDDFTSTECHFSPVAGSSPGAGATPVAVYHTHPADAGEDVYGCDKDSNGVKPRQYPGGPGILPTMESPDSTGGGSGWRRHDSKGDWPYADQFEAPVFILQKDGRVWKLPPHFPLPKKNNPNKWNAYGGTGKCTWPKFYYPA